MSNHSRGNADWLTETDSPDYIDSVELRSYAAAIEQIIHAVPDIGNNQPGTITIRSIHEQLGENAKREWTLDAINTLKSVEPIGILPTRYRKKIGVPPSYTKLKKGQEHRWMFPKNELIHEQV